MTAHSNNIRFFKMSEKRTFKDLANATIANDFPQTCRCIRDIFAIDYEVSEKVARHFMNLYKQDKHALLKTMDIYGMVINSELIALVPLLGELFGLYGVDALKAIEQLQKIADG